MKIVCCHNYYQQPGGEDQVFAEEVELLSARGHEVVRFTVHNDEVRERSGLSGRLRLARDTFWNPVVYRQVRDIVARERAEIVHFHNTFPLMSPSAYYGARAAGAAVVQTLHNYRFVCPNAQFFRDGRVCEDCAGKQLPWPGVLHACYRGSRTATAVTAGMLAAHRAAGTYRRVVDLYLALTEFARGLYVRGGLPEERVVVKPNFIGADSGVGNGSGGFGVFVGRLDAGKGVPVLLDAWAKLGGPTRLKLIGDGELAPAVRAAAAADPRIEFMGRQPSAEVYRLMGEAAFLVLPALWYEGLPRTIVEAFCKGTPVIISRIGALPDLVEHGRTGLVFAAGDPDDLRRQVTRFVSNPAAKPRMRAEARREYETKYTADQNYQLLMDCYAQALRNRWSAAASRGAADVHGERAIVADPLQAAASRTCDEDSSSRCAMTIAGRPIPPGGGATGTTTAQPPDGGSTGRLGCAR